MRVNELPNGILYLEHAFPLASKFLEELEENNENHLINEIIPPWEDWVDGYPIQKKLPDGSTVWEQFFDSRQHRGTVKTVDWDLSINNGNDLWPRIEVEPDYDDSHRAAYKLLEKIDKPYKNALKIWSEKTNNNFPESWVTKNYTIRKYKTGGSMGAHVDKNIDNPLNSMDWTCLIYLNDDYEGGELVFDNLNIELKPTAGSAVFFPCLESHSVNEIVSGTKTYIFMFIHLDVGISTALGESYQGLTEKIKASRQ